MTEQESFTKHEHAILPNFREKINRSESTEDVKKFSPTPPKSFSNMFSEDELNLNMRTLR